MKPSDLEKIAAKLPVSEATRRRNPTLCAGENNTPETVNGNAQVKDVPARAIHLPRMNKLEQRFLGVLRAWYPSAHITPQFRLRVSAFDSPVACHYTCDFLVSMQSDDVFSKDCWMHWCYEVKDKRRKPHSDELMRPKMVRVNNPWINTVILAVWDGKEFRLRPIA